jgi:hypothetical protein
MLCVSLIMSLSVRKYKISAGKIVLLRLSLCKHWTTDGGVPKVPLQFVKFVCVSSVQWAFPGSCKAFVVQGQRKWPLGCVSYTTPDLSTFDSYFLGGWVGVGCL